MLQIIYGNNGEKALDKILNRSITATEEIEVQVRQILQRVRKEGEKAVKEYTKQFDQVNLEEFEVTEAEFQQALADVEKPLVEALLAAKKNIEAYHMNQLQKGYEITDEKKMLKQVIRPIESVGVYVPGGKAAYPSTVLMDVIPAKIAGVPDITMVIPPNKDGKVKNSLLAAAKIVGVDRVLKIGGAQAIGALAYGTENIQKVDKIVGPGNAYVAMAKKLVSGDVGIDMIAGPTEVVVLADETANPAFIAADLMAQAEHDEMASSIVITTSDRLAKEIQLAAKTMIESQPRKEIIKASFEQFGAIIVTDTMEEGIRLVNKIAPEHLEIVTMNPFAVYPDILHAGAIFLGPYTPEPVGDYYAGTNHTLPTNGTSRFSSPLNVNDFQKKTSVVYFSEEALEEAREHIEAIAEEEGLFGHKQAVAIRFKEEKQ